MVKKKQRCFKPINELKWWQKIFWSKARQFSHIYDVKVGKRVGWRDKMEGGKVFSSRPACSLCTGAIYVLTTDGEYYYICLDCPKIHNAYAID